MKWKSKTVCLSLLGLMGGTFLCALVGHKGSPLWDFGAPGYLLSALLSVPVSMVMVIVEWRRVPQRAFGWPLLLLATSALPLLWLLGFLLLDPD